MSLALLDAYRATDRLMRENLELYCRNLVKIQGKEPGQLVPFVWKHGQRLLHERIEDQLARTGRVRVLVLKARQLGISTYTTARFYNKTTLNMGRRSYILTHEDKATQQLYGMVKRIHENMPSDYRPGTDAANANEFNFTGLNSGYRVGTAQNTKGSGRSLTLHQFHGSEVAFWPQGEVHLASVLQALSQAPGTEAVLESTANGVGGVFYDQWALAEKGQSDYMPVFLPWFIDPEYTRPLQANFDPSAEEEDYQRIYRLTDEQLCWLHYKNIELGGLPGKLCPLLRQEYPANAAEAFQSTGDDSFISAELVLAARRNEVGDQSYLPRVLGVDVARGGGDLTRFVDRQGRKSGRINVKIDKADLVFIANEMMKLLLREGDIRKAYIDVTGLGAGVYDIARANGFEDRVVAVNFGQQAQDPQRFVNKRAEIWWRGREWLMDPGGADLPDDDLVQRHITAPGYLYDSNSRFQLESKDNIKKRLKFSPDWGDAWALTFSDHLAVELPDETPKWFQDHLHGADDWGSGGGWETA